eukprot:TRINITY_DN30253_c0_g1_i1.p1 TRINITY_DN30253_c0_g1~~TRINITY_DN30253_c0_g1_i1.p1  ORF type:complete len:388 (+),score=55.17 TRINITY_DN30253_c0_g1_i1:83-1246(+)
MMSSIPVGHNLVLNVLAYVPFLMLLNWLAGLSMQYQQFMFCWSLMPTLLVGIVYYGYKFGPSSFTFSWEATGAWLNNWLMANSIALVSFTQVVVHYAVLLQFEAFLPRNWQGTFSFPVSELETSVQVVVKIFAVWGLLLLASLPLWMHGYKLSLDLVGRGGDITVWETVLEIVYTTSQAAVVLQLQLPLAMIQVNLGYPFHYIHFIFALLESAMLHAMVKYKYAWLHKLAHEVRPLHHLTHMEHHVCKGIYCTTPAAGLWETWVEGGTLFFCNSLAMIPYLYFHAVVAGANVIVHTMWPHKSMVQWHTFHHVVHADIYAVNIPSAQDMEFSRDVKRLKSSLEKASPFVRHGWLSDATGFLLSAVSGVVLHYVFEIGLFQVWHLRIST